MMEKLGLPQTHLSLKAMINRVDDDHDGKISFREVIQLNSFISIHQLSHSLLVSSDLSKNHRGK